MRWRQRAYSRPLTHTHRTRQLYVSTDMGKQGQEQKSIDLPVRLSSPASTAASPTRLDRAKPGWVACALARS